MAVKIEEFLKTAKRRRKKQRLEPYKEDIIKLIAEDITYVEIQRYLQLNGVNVSIPTIATFIRRLNVEPNDQSDF